MNNYEIWLTSDSGTRLAYLSTFISLECSRVVNGMGAFGMIVPLSFNPELLVPDRMVQVWRQPSGSKSSLWRVYFLRRWKFSTKGSNQIVQLAGPDLNELLRRRIVAAYAGSAQASKTGFADNIMKSAVRESLLDSASPIPTAGTRVWPNLSVAADLGLGPSITKEFPWEKLLASSNQGVLPQLANAAKEAGTEVFFDVVPGVVASNSITFQFQTFVGQPGPDVSNRVTFDQQSGNMVDPELEYDYSEEENYIYSAGQGESTGRVVQQVYDSTRYGQSIWGRCEGYADARNQGTDNGVREAGRGKLNEGRPKIRITAKPVDTAGTRFGVNWDFGYKVGARYMSRQFKSIIRAVTITVNENGDEDIRARLDYEGFV